MCLEIKIFKEVTLFSKRITLNNASLKASIMLFTLSNGWIFLRKCIERKEIALIDVTTPISIWKCESQVIKPRRLVRLEDLDS